MTTNLLVHRHEESVHGSLPEEVLVWLRECPDLGLVVLPGQNELNLGLRAVTEHRAGLDDDLVEIKILGQVVRHPVRLLLLHIPDKHNQFSKIFSTLTHR